MQPTHETTFVGNDLSALEAEAAAQGVTLKELVETLVSSTVRRRYLIPKLSAAPVVPFPRRHTAPENFCVDIA